MNVPVMVTSPYRAGSLVFAAAAAIGAEPRPASFEKIPLATPFLIESRITEVPAAPPAIGLKPKAPLTISDTAFGISVT